MALNAISIENNSSTEVPSASKIRSWSGWGLSGFASLFMIFDGLMKIVQPTPVVEASAKLGMHSSTLTAVGIALLAFTILYMIPRTSALGAVLITGFLGGAVAANVIAQTPTFNLAFPLIFAAMVWGGLLLRNPRSEALLGLSRFV